MKAISIYEPYASLIRTGAKTYETRSWSTSYRGPLLICAAKYGISRTIMIDLLGRYVFQKGLRINVDKHHTWLPSSVVQYLNFGKAVAIVELVDCVLTNQLYLSEEPEIYFGDFTPGRYAWKLKMTDNTFEPFPVRGKQGFFEVDLPWREEFGKTYIVDGTEITDADIAETKPEQAY